MFYSLYPIILILLFTSKVNLSRNDYEYYDSLADPYMDSPSRNREYDYGYQKETRYRVAPYMTLPDERDAMPVQQRGVIGNVVGKVSSVLKGILAGGKCLIRCVLNWSKSCGGIISCPWNCLFPDRPMPSPKEDQTQNDDDILLVTDIELRAPGTASKKSSLSILNPSEIVMLVKCYVRCLVRYLPRGITTLTQMMFCTISRCLCNTESTNQSN